MEVTIEDLHEMGLDYRWLVAAERVGVATFLAVWQALEDVRPEPEGAGRESVRVRIPSLSRLRRQLRNRWIQQLDGEGYQLEEIQQVVATPERAGDLCEVLSKRHISRIIGKE
jgi:hypothetical protein